MARPPRLNGSAICGLVLRIGAIIVSSIALSITIHTAAKDHHAIIGGFVVPLVLLIVDILVLLSPFAASLTFVRERVDAICLLDFLFLVAIGITGGVNVAMEGPLAHATPGYSDCYQYNSTLGYEVNTCYVAPWEDEDMLLFWVFCAMFFWRLVIVATKCCCCCRKARDPEDDKATHSRGRPTLNGTELSGISTGSATELART